MKKSDKTNLGEKNSVKQSFKTILILSALKADFICSPSCKRDDDVINNNLIINLSVIKKQIKFA